MYIDPPDNNKPATSLSDVERDDVLVSLHLPKRTIDSLEVLGRGLDLTVSDSALKDGAWVVLLA